MKFLTAEQFLQADTKVQNAILDWWKPSVGDLIASTKDDNKYCVIDNFIEAINCCSLNLYSTINCTATKDEIVPLLTEGQLREFIEEITDSKMDIMYSYIHYRYEIYLNKNYEQFVIICSFKIKSDSLLQALWEIVNKIVEEEN